MKVKYILRIDDIEYDISHDVKNWEDITTEVARSDYKGAVRTMASSFAFVGSTYDLLFDLFKSRGYNASAHLSLFTMNDRWEWDKIFETDLDFTSISWDEYVLEIFCSDRSLASLLKANKSVKYEFEVGKDIYPDRRLDYDRVEMMNTVTYGIVGDGSTENGDIILDEAPTFKRLPTYVLNDDEVYDGSPVYFKDQDSESGAFMLMAERSVNQICVDVEISADAYSQIEIRLFEFDGDNPDFNSSYRDLGKVFDYGADMAKTRNFLGYFSSVEEMKAIYPEPPFDCWAGIGTHSDTFLPYAPTGQPYFCAIDFQGNRYWERGNLSFYFDGPDWNIRYYCITQKTNNRIIINNVIPGKRYALFYKTYVPSSVIDRRSIQRISSKVTSQWKGRGNAIDIDVMSPCNVLETLVRKISGNADVWARISHHDARLLKTFVVGGESIRGIKEAKFTTSFNDFCNWMEAVFGYTYKIENDNDCRPGIMFIHRSELFDPSARLYVIQPGMIRELRCNSAINLLYAAVEVGYEKHDYEAACGRDEWNFSAQYTTGYSLLEKKLSLKSPYRADCYGFEFIAQKRTNETTDDKSDASVFFVYCDEIADPIEGPAESRGDSHNVPSGTTHLVINRDETINGALSDTVFNGIFSPYYCVKANEGYISAMADEMTLAFASCDGNKDIIVNGHKMNEDIPLSGQLFSSMEVTFQSVCDSVLPDDIDICRIRFDNGGVRYTGFLDSVRSKYARDESHEFTIIVKTIERL